MSHSGLCSTVAWPGGFGLVWARSQTLGWSISYVEPPFMIGTICLRLCMAEQDYHDSRLAPGGLTGPRSQFWHTSCGLISDLLVVMQAPHEGIFLIPSLTTFPGHRHRHPGWRFFDFFDIRLGSFWSVSDFLNVTIEVGRSVLVVLNLMSIFSTSVWAHSAPHNWVCRCAAPGIRHFARSLWQEISSTKSSSMVPHSYFSLTSCCCVCVAGCRILL